jgi:Nucleotide-diphospho-sugar transferase
LRRYVTYFDSNYAARGVAMIESLLAFDAQAEVTVACLDERIETVLVEELGGRVECLRLEQLAAFEPRLVDAWTGRSRWEHIATHKPVVVAWMLERAAPGQTIAFIDADTLFFSDPAPVFAEVADASIALSPHRFNRRTAHLAHAGAFNAGFIVWRNDAVARQCAADWIEDCLAWCHDHDGSEGRFMNQGYLERWPERYPGVKAIAHAGANLALWNVESHRLAATGSGVSVDGQPLVFFHYSSMATSRGGDWYSLHPLPARLAPLLRAAVFRPYFDRVAAVSRRLAARHGLSGTATARNYDWARVTWLTGWRAHMPLYRTVRRLIGHGARRARSILRR